ncbi:hypothetical protein WJX72_003804 [[Myrmecia] bisecta]|uniref:Cytochrome b561 domain-containing protein n=1 Tax=[Myrmecia] bisecta TaxID=41462 RepID=A0AAW1PCT9_9CHLO
MKRRLMQDAGPLVVEEDSSGPSYDCLIPVSVHGWLMCVSCGLLIPLGVLIAHSFKSYRKPIWLYLHILCNGLGFLLAVAGVSVGHYLTVDTQEQKNHRTIGITVIVMAGVQVLVGPLKPKSTSPLRRTFNVVHHWNGRIALGLAVANIFLGMHIAEPGKRYYIAQAVILGVIALIGVFWDSLMYIRLTPPAYLEAMETGRGMSSRMVKSVNNS